ncbi:hypothetical protein DFH07DRAFT_793462 [Mycena maculata]|uniref:Uncharacterized protein n=1 Tax=Mycena maculata TaxID=230809 RepID=A0AAD7KAX1_9AGAR|nr:hypothetical protein DFH07DRAFT_793462 [Mycena maculata]
MDIEEAATVLAEIVTAGLHNEPYPLDPLYSDKETCTALISRRPELNRLLEVAHRSKEHGPVQRHPSIRRTKGKDSLNTFLKKLRPPFMRFLDGDDGPFDRFIPDSKLEPDSSIVTHVESLEIPAVSKKPGLLIHQLGRFEEDPQLMNRVNGIFQKNKITFLVNTSGSGKTRLSFEGLCRHWGFYFIMARDGNNLGAADLGENLYGTLDGATDFRYQLPATDSPNFQKMLKRNMEIVDERFGLVLLGRLLIFHMYSELIQPYGIREEHKKKWLLFQLKPQLPGDSSYDVLTDVQGYMDDLKPDEVLDLIAVMYCKLRKIHGPQFHLFYVLDEAQLVSRQHTSAFQHEGKQYPLLREIVQTWSAKSHPQESSFVVLGTDIPREGFESAPFSGSINWLSDTGGFDDETEHRRYVSSFLDPSYQATPAGEEFLRRVWTWCRGRYRSTDALIKALLMDAFRTPHKLLNDYVEKATTHRPTDYDDDEPFRYPIDVAVRELDPEFFTVGPTGPLRKSTVQQVLFHYLATSHHPSPFPADLTPLVSSGFGRFADKKLSSVVMDEPMFLLRAARWLCERPEPEFSFPPVDPPHNCYTVLERHQTSTTSRSLAGFLAFYLTRAFDNGPTLSNVFSFPHKSVHKWAQQKAQLVAFREKEASTVGYASTLPALAASPSTLAGVDSWLDGATGFPFCLTPTADPDLIFHLKLADERFLRVILHSAVTDVVLKDITLKAVLHRLEPDRLLREEASDTDSSEHASVVAKLLDTTQDDGPFRILRVVASFPALTHLKTVSPKSASSPFANLNTGLFKRLTEDIPVSDLFEQLLSSVTVGKRKRDALPPPDTRAKKKARPESDAPRTSRPRKGKGKAS